MKRNTVVRFFVNSKVFEFVSMTPQQWWCGNALRPDHNFVVMSLVDLFDSVAHTVVSFLLPYDVATKDSPDDTLKLFTSYSVYFFPILYFLGLSLTGIRFFIDLVAHYSHGGSIIDSFAFFDYYVRESQVDLSIFLRFGLQSFP
jgi:hypothetical protein